MILANLPGRLPDARKSFEKSMELAAPDSAEWVRAAFQLSGTCLQLGDSAAARKHAAEAIRVDRAIGVLTPEQRRQMTEIVTAVSSASKP